MASSWNLLMDGMARTPLSKREGQVVAAIARKTLGYQQLADRIPVSQLVTLTGMDQRHVSETLSRLAARNIISRSGGRAGHTHTATITLNLDTTQWDNTSPESPRSDPPKTVSLKPAENGESEKPRTRRPKPPKTAGLNTPVAADSRGKGVEPTGGKPETQATVAAAVDAYRSTGGNLELSARRGALAGNVKAALAAGHDLATITAAAKELGRANEFPGYLRTKADEIREAGGPCAWDGLQRSALTLDQLRTCPCRRCTEWATYKENEALTGAHADA